MWLTLVCCCFWPNTKPLELHRRPADIEQQFGWIVQTAGLDTSSYHTHTHTRMIQHCDVSSSSLIFKKIYPDNQFWCVCVCVYVETASDWCYMTRSDIFGMGLCIKVNIRRNRMQWLSIDPFWISSDPMVSLERYTSWYFTVDNVLSKILAPYFTVIYAKANTVGGMGCVKPDAPSTQEPTGHC